METYRSIFFKISDMNFNTVNKAILLLGVCLLSVDSATFRNKDVSYKQVDTIETLHGGKEEWNNADLAIRVTALSTGFDLPEEGITKEIATLKNKFDNKTMPPLLCWEMECPDCSKLETPQRCFARGILQVSVRSLIVLLVVAMLAVCVVAVNHKNDQKKSRKGKAVRKDPKNDYAENDKNDEKKTASYGMHIDYLVKTKYWKGGSTESDKATLIEHCEV